MQAKRPMVTTISNAMQFDFRTELGKISPRIAKGAKIYVFGTGANWKNICTYYKSMVNIDIDDYIDGFIDNDIAKQGNTFHGKMVYSPAEIDHANAVVLISIASYETNIEILEQLVRYRMFRGNSLFMVSHFYEIVMCHGHERMWALKNKHKGERCFIIGNGTSLTTKDLGMLKNEITFASNMIYLIYDQTDWRPSYYACQDAIFFGHHHHEILDQMSSIAFYPDFFLTNHPDFYQAIFFTLQPDNAFSNGRNTFFSEDPFFMHNGATVTYVCLQLAVHMGFREIYLLGVDNTFLRGVKRNGELVSGIGMHTHFSSDYDESVLNFVYIDSINSAYQAAKTISEKHNIKICNATRGGELEIFDRVDFDSLF